MFNWTLKSIPIKDLKDHAKNPRQIGKDQLNRLSGIIDKFGLIDKPICNLDLEVIAGHQRLKILKKKRIKTVECWIPDSLLTPDEVEELLIGHNLHQGSFDIDILANEWDFEKLLNYGFTEEYLLNATKEAQQSIEEILAADDPEDELEVGKEEEAITKIGDVYELGHHRLVCGDCTDIDIIAQAIGEHEIKLAIADPPYNVNYKYNEDISDSKSDMEYREFIQKYIANALSFSNFMIVTPGKVNSRKYDAKLICDEAIWYKSNACTHGSCTNFMCIEPILFLGQKPKSKKYDRDLFDIPQSKQQDVGNHTCPKPLELWTTLIDKMSDKGDYVLEMFLGSGTALISCEALKRHCIGIELSPAYCDLIVKRYINFMGKKGVNVIIKRNGEIIDHKGFI